jgi:hypothetical protein
VFKVIITFAFVALVSFAQAQTSLISVNWTASGSAPQANTSGTLAGLGTVSVNTSRVNNAGSVFAGSNYSWSSGYTFSVNEFVGLGVGGSSNDVQTFTFSQNISNPYLIFNWIDAGSSFDFGSNSYTLLGSANATSSGNLITAGAGAGTTESDGFLIRLNGTFGPTSALTFTFRNTAGPQTIGATVAAVPEPSSLSLLAVGLGALAMMRRRRGC